MALHYVRTYKTNSEVVEFSKFFENGDLVDWDKMLTETNGKALAVKIDGARVLIDLVYDGDRRDYSKAQLCYRVMSVMCELLRNIVDIKVEDFAANSRKKGCYSKDVRKFIRILSKTYSFDGIVVSVDLLELRASCRKYDMAIRKASDVELFNSDDRRILDTLLEELAYTKLKVGKEIDVRMVPYFKVDLPIFNLTSGIIEDVIEQLPLVRNFYVDLTTDVKLLVTDFDCSDLAKLNVVAEICWFAGYFYDKLDDNMKFYLDRLWLSDDFKYKDYSRVMFYGDFGIVYNK